MGTISVHDIERDPSGFLARLAAGEPLRIEDNGRPVAEVRPATTSPPPGQRPHGLAKGMFVVPDDVNDPMELVPAPAPPVGEVSDPYLPSAETPTRRPFGLAKGKIIVHDGFDDPLPEDILRDFEGRDR